MSSNLGRQVKWQDDKGGWHTGREVTTPLGVGVTYFEPRLVKRYIMPPYDSSIPSGFNLVKEDNCGTLTWVESNKLSDWPITRYCSVCCKEKDKCECNKGSWGHTLSTHKQVMEEIVQPIPQSKVTREEVLQAVLEQIKEEEEALLTLNSKLQEEYAEQVIQNQIECNYT